MRVSLLILLIFCGALCHAQESKTYQLNKKLDYSIGGACLTMGIADLVMEDRLTGLGEPEILNLNIDDIPRIDRSTVDQNSASAKSLSDVFEYGVFFVPAPLFLSDKVRRESKEIGVMYFEAFSFNVLSTQLVKLITKRNRPFLYNPEFDLKAKQTSNGRKSFYSGHVSHTATISIFTAKVFSDLYPNSKWKPIIWTSAFLIPTTTGYLRYKAGRHFPTDIAAGLVAGSLIGYFVPELHRLKNSLPEGLSLSSKGSGVALTYEF